MGDDRKITSLWDVITGEVGGAPSDGFDFFSFLYAFSFITNLDEIETQGILHMVAEILPPQPKNVAMLTQLRTTHNHT